MFRDLPTNLITGFLGTGKTTAILHLLASAPTGQRWAVLVNEFGRIGVDGDLMRDSQGEGTDIFVEEVAGGCLCCVGSAGMQVGLNRLIKAAKPDRILIEPTGLGHPAQLLDQLQGPLYSDVLDLRATIGILDARALRDKRYTGHPNFQDQIHLADVLIGNKLDCYGETDREAFYSLLESQSPPKQAAALVEGGRFDPAFLDLERLPRQALFPEAHAFHEEHGHHEHHKYLASGQRVEGDADGFHSCGWMLSPGTLVDTACLKQMMTLSGLERLKGFVQTPDGRVRINATRGEWSEARAMGSESCRIEVISADPMDWNALERQLRDCEIS